MATGGKRGLSDAYCASTAKRWKQYEESVGIQAFGSQSAVVSLLNLEHLFEMPLDVIYEIFSHLAPTDLLQLARLTKSLRSLLMDRSSTAVWKAARHQVPDFPECPSYLSEPQYASLMFDSYCFNCRADDVLHVHTMFNARYCEKCSKLMVVLKLGGENALGDLMVLPHTLGLGARRRPGYFFHQPDVLQFQDTISKISSEEMREEYILSQAELTSRIMDTAPLLGLYLDKVQKERTNRLRAEKDLRFSAIYSRTRVNWRQELDFLSQSKKSWARFREHPLVKSPEKLTESVWQTICPEIDEFMGGIKQHRLDVEQKQKLMVRFNGLQELVYEASQLHNEPRQLLPHAIDICTFPEVRSIIEPPSGTFPLLINLAPITSMWSILTTRWRSEIDSQLRAHIESNVTGDVDSLSLAIAIFKCKGCNVDEDYPSVLSHRCCHRSVKDPGYDVVTYPIYENAARAALKSTPWSCAELEWCPWIDKFAKILQTCELDPQTATRAQMNESGIRLYCVLCLERGTKKAMTWRKAFDHCIHRHTRAEADEMLWERADLT